MRPMQIEKDRTRNVDDLACLNDFLLAVRRQINEEVAIRDEVAHKNSKNSARAREQAGGKKYNLFCLYFRYFFCRARAL